MSSVAALALLIPGATIKAPLTSNGMSRCGQRAPAKHIFDVLHFKFSRRLIMIVDWFEITEEIAVTWSDPIAVYAASKSIAEKALWAFAKERPELNLVTRKFHSCAAPPPHFISMFRGG
jgi:hypothetical protein